MKPISSIYRHFFARNASSGAVVLQGSRRSGKTWAVLAWLPVVAAQRGARKIMVVAPDYPMLRATMSDFEAIFGLPVTGSLKNGLNAHMLGVKYEFRAFDRPHKAQGTSADVIFFNEAAQMDEQMVLTATLSSRALLVFDFNPTHRFWVGRYIAPDRSNYLLTTWRDNEHLTDQQRQYFLDIEARAASPEATAIDRYMRDVYCHGRYNELTGNVWAEVEAVPRSEWPTDMETVYGLDFGYQADPTALVEVGVRGGTIYARELLYVHGYDDAALAEAMSGIIDYERYVIYDWGAGGDVRAANLSRMLGAGWFVPASKGRVIDDLAVIGRYALALDGENILREAQAYELSGGKVRGEDHALDAMRYAVIKQLR